MEGLIPVTGCEAPRIGDVVFVHGLDGDARETWHPRGKPEDFWPSWLGEEHPGLGIWTLGYAVSSSAWKGHSMPLVDRATHTLDLFELDGIGSRPVVFICHSLGGLLVKQVLRTAWDSTRPAIRALAENTRAIMFLSTPHSGSDIASWLKHVGTLVRATVSVDELRAHDSKLRELNMWYRDHVAELDIETFVYCEKLATKGVLVVNETSADPGIPGVRPVPLDENHASICKPASRRSQVYRRASRLLKNLSGAGQAAPEIERPEALAGTWIAEVEREGLPGYRIKLELEVMNDALFGTVRYPTGRAGIHDGVIDGERISFSTTHTPQFESAPATIRFEGKIVDGGIRGVLQDGSGHGRVTARRPD